MESVIIQDRLHRAAGRCALRVGAPCFLHRPRNSIEPMAPPTRILSLQAAFLPPSGHLARTPGFGEVMWHGVFDAAYSKAGDIIVRASDGAVHYVASQPPLLHPLCIRAARIVDVARPATSAIAGLATYGGTVTAGDTILATRWPAAILGIGGQGTGSSDIAADLSAGAWQVFLPVSLAIGLRNGDKILDDTGRVGVIATMELTDLGWRLLVRQASP